MAIAKHDGFAANFILTGDQRLVGIDFEVASMKPPGWTADQDTGARQALTDLAVFFAEATKDLGPGA